MNVSFYFPKGNIQKENRKEINYPTEISGKGGFTKQNIFISLSERKAIAVLF